MNAATLHPNLRAADLAIEIADEYARSDIECKAQTAQSTYPSPVYDTTLPEGPIDEPELVDAAMADVARAVRYLDLRGLLVRPFLDMPHLVSFGRSS